MCGRMFREPAHRLNDYGRYGILDVDNTQNIISFCTGYGGLELGIRRAGVDVRTVCNVEIAEAFVTKNLVDRLNKGWIIRTYGRVRIVSTFPAQMFRGKEHGPIGGYPFDSAQVGEKDPRTFRWQSLLVY